MIGIAVNDGILRRPNWFRYFRLVKTRHFLLLFVLFLSAAIWLSVRIMKLELQAATSRLVGHSAGASRNLETQFDSLRDDFRVLVSTGAFEVYTKDSQLTSRDFAMVRRFFARYQEMITAIELELDSNETIRIELAPGNYLRTSRKPSTNQVHRHSSPSLVDHSGDNLILEEQVPTADSQLIRRVRLIIDHNRFFNDRLASYLMGQSDLWIWAIEENAKPTLIHNPLKAGDVSFGVDPETIRRIQTTLDRGLEGVDEHEILAPSRRSVVSVFTPLLLGDEQMGLVFSTDREVHLGSLHRLSTFLGLIFLGSLVLLGSWFAISYTRIRESEREQAAARQRAEAADRAKSEFVAAMSHEIRTPLNGVLGYADLLMESKLSNEQRSHVEVIRNSGGHLLSILNDILDFSKIVTGNMTLRSQEYSPVECADEVIDMMTTAAEDQGLELYLDVESEMPAHVIGDPGRLSQILYNLVGNGIKFTHRGSVRVSMKASDAGDHWRLDFTVSDTGIGIPEEKRERLFAPFSQLDSSSAREYEGAGLGLAICRRLAENMGGGIDFTSRPGAGSDFHFWIHADKVEASSRRPEIRPLDGKTVLLIGPTSQSFDSLSSRIRRMGARVLTAENEVQAARVISRSTKIDFIMLDWQGDDITAGTSIGPLLEERQGRRVPMIALSSPQVENEPPNGRFADRMTKPVRVASLERLVTKLTTSPAEKSTANAAKHPIRVLVAEDNMINSELMVALLEQRGVQTSVASNGLETLIKLEEHHYDLVFMDVEMPGLDGIEVTKRIRDREPHGVHTRIIGLSAHAFHEDRSLAMQAGMDDYLTKPIDLTELDRALAFAAEGTLSPPRFGKDRVAG